MAVKPKGKSKASKKDESVRNPYKESAYGVLHNAMTEISEICIGSAPPQVKVQAIHQQFMMAKMQIANQGVFIELEMGMSLREVKINNLFTFPAGPIAEPVDLKSLAES